MEIAGPEKPLLDNIDVLTAWKDRLGFDLRLMSSVNDVSGIPTAGKSLIIVAAVNNVLHFRIFDGDGKVVVDTDEKRLTEQARQIEDLRKRLESLWPPHELTKSDKGRVITAVTSIVGHTNRPKLVIVAVTGGAYRSGFWTATVLDELNRRSRTDPDLKGLKGLTDHIRLITGASGGMVGALYFVALRGQPDASLVTGCDLRLMSSVTDVSGIPTAGKSLIIVAAVDHVLHFRIFDGDGKVVVDTDEKRLTEQARQIEDLRKQLESLWPPHELTKSEKGRVIDRCHINLRSHHRQHDRGHGSQQSVPGHPTDGPARHSHDPLPDHLSEVRSWRRPGGPVENPEDPIY